MATRTAKKESDLEKLMKKLKPAQIRFVYLYMGAEDGKCYNNATASYIRAYEIDTPTRKVKLPDGSEGYTSEYKSAKTKGYQLLTNGDIQKLRNLLLSEIGIDKEWIKRRYADFAVQNKNPALALTATDRLAKITGVVIDDTKKVDIPQITELANAIKGILTPKK